jgi:prepilin-type N-terminal cleavage/methylation domain-containing protein
MNVKCVTLPGDRLRHSSDRRKSSYAAQSLPITAAVDRSYTHSFVARVRARFARLLRQESGFTLIEVVVSAALLAVVTAGVYAGIDGPTKISGQAKERAAASNLAQADQERMRAMRFADLQNYAPTPATQTIDGTKYTIASRADWVDDSDAANACTVPNNQGDYLKLSSTVSWAGGGAGNPAVITSLLAPPVNDSTNGTGNIVVTLTDQANAPVANIPVTISGRTNATKSTDANGCAVFTNVLAGNYTATLNSAGYVDNQNAQAVTMQAGVSAGSTIQLQHSYAKAGQVTVNFVASDGTTPVSWTKASVGSGALLSPKVLTSGVGVTSLNTGKTLYPSTSGSYVGWAGGCADPGSPYNQTATPTPLAPNGISSVNVILPILTLKVPTTGLPSAPRIVVKPSDPSCTDTFTVPAATVVGTSPNQQYQWTMRLPRAKYSLCADLLSNRTQNPFTISNQAQAGTTAQLGVTTNGFGQVTGATANDGSGLQNTPIISGSCPP